MVPGEFGSIFVGAAASEQRAATGVMESRVVQDRQAGPAKQIRPDELVQLRVSKLIHDDVVLPLRGAPDEVMRALDTQAARRGWRGVRHTRDRDRRLVDEDIDTVSGVAEKRDDLG